MVLLISETGQPSWMPKAFLTVEEMHALTMFETLPMYPPALTDVTLRGAETVNPGVPIKTE